MCSFLIWIYNILNFSYENHAKCFQETWFWKLEMDSGSASSTPKFAFISLLDWKSVAGPYEKNLSKGIIIWAKKIASVN